MIVLQDSNLFVNMYFVKSFICMHFAQYDSTAAGRNNTQHRKIKLIHFDEVDEMVVSYIISPIMEMQGSHGS